VAEFSPDAIAEAVATAVAKQAEALRTEFEARLAASEARHQAELAQVRAASIPVPHLIPEHGAGPGITIRDTWSQWEQELARKGEWKEPESD